MKTKSLAACLVFLAITTNAFGLTAEERAVVTQMKNTIVSLRAKLSSADKANVSALSALTKASSQLMVLQNDLRLADARFKQVITERDQNAQDLQVAKERYSALNKRYQTAQFIIAIVSGLLAAGLAFYFSQGLLPPYSLIFPLGAGAAVFGIIYIVI